MRPRGPGHERERRVWTEGGAGCGSTEIVGAAEGGFKTDPGCLIHAE